MLGTPTVAERMRASLVLVATLGTIAYNWLAAMGLVNGVTPAMISERHPSIITPAGYAFSIWSLIYLWLVAFSIYQILPRAVGRFSHIRTYYLASCALNIAWIWFWHRGSIEVCLVLIATLTAVLVLLMHRTKNADSNLDAALTKAPFGIYAGWVTCAMLVNLNIVFADRVAGYGALVVLGVASIIAAAVAAVVVCRVLDNYFYPLAVAWAITAIAIKQSANTPLVVAAAFATVTCLVISGSVVTRLKDSTSE
jgi:translocator protein